MDITENIPAPQLTLSQVYYALLNTKQTSTGPNNLPFWVWKENAAILACTCSASNLEPILVNSKGGPVHGSKLMSIRYPK